MRIAVCDDEENALRQVRSVINKLSVVDEAEYYSDMDVFMERINTGIYYDIVMMDIDWNSGRTVGFRPMQMLVPKQVKAYE